ncbi:MAG TPA: O-antigen ligase family protein [Alphaproteobacteria bacterium]|nr:O-antigen ligase family protein [Alphaproteobacteria bacterium]
MTAVSPAADEFRLDHLKRLIVFAIVLALFYVGENYKLAYKLGGIGDERSATMVIETSGGGGSLRPLMFGLLGMLGIVCWMWRPARLRTNMHGWLPALIFAFIAYASLSILWAEDQAIVMRRVVTLVLTCFGAFGLVHRFSNRDFLVFCFLSGAILGLGSLASEIATGVFRPWTSDYRLYGLMHANTLGPMMAIFVLSAVALRRCSESHRGWYTLWIIIGLGLMILTKSRTAMIGLVAALWVWVVFGSTNRKRLAALCVLTLALALPAAVLLFGEQLGIMAKQTALMGREGNSPETLTGRIPLWDFLISNYLDVRPLFGYGFQGFWTPQHILRVSASQDWLILHAHSGYLNLVLELGYIGLGLFALVLVLATRRSYIYFRDTRDVTWLFMTSLLVWAIVASFFDSHLLTSSLRNFICMIAFAKLAMFDPRFVRVRQPAYA